MSSSTSPLHVLQKEAKRIARRVKQASLTLNNPVMKVGLAMDDKFLIIEINRNVILKSSHEALAAMIVREMRGEKTQ